VFDYLQSQSTATALLARFGITATFSRTTGATFSPGAGSFTGGTATTISGKAVRTEFKQSEIDGQLVQAGDFKLMFSGAASAPAIGDSVLFDGESFRVMDSNPAKPASVVVLYVVHCRS
jgi:hypothetical protein